MQSALILCQCQWTAILPNWKQDWVKKKNLYQELKIPDRWLFFKNKTKPVQLLCWSLYPEWRAAGAPFFKLNSGAFLHLKEVSGFAIKCSFEWTGSMSSWNLAFFECLVIHRKNSQESQNAWKLSFPAAATKQPLSFFVKRVVFILCFIRQRKGPCLLKFNKSIVCNFTERSHFWLPTEQ